MLTNIIAAIGIILLMIIFRQKISYLIIFCLFVFANPPFGDETILRMLRWVLYIGFILLAFLYNKDYTIRNYTMRRILPSDFFILFFIFVLFISYNVSIIPDLTFKRGVSILLMYGACFFGIYSFVFDINAIYKILQSLFIFLVIFNILSLIPGIGFSVAGGRFAGLSGAPTGMAAMNVFILPIGLMIYNFKRTKMNLLIIFFILGIIYITYTRTAFIVAVLVIIFFNSQLFRKTKIVFIFVALLIIASIFISFFIFGIWFPEKLVRIKTLPFLGGRIEAWQAARDIISKRPLYGFGFGTEQFLFRHFNIRLSYHSGQYFHNSFLGLAAQIGIPTTVIFFAIIIFFTISAINFVTKITDMHLKLIGITLNTILFVGFIYCFAESWIYSAGNVLAFIYFLVVMLTIRFKEFVGKLPSTGSISQPISKSG